MRLAPTDFGIKIECTSPDFSKMVSTTPGQTNFMKDQHKIVGSQSSDLLYILLSGKVYACRTDRLSKI